MLKIGDRVSRQINIGQPERKYGTITKVYKSKQGVGFSQIPLYDIKWDLGTEEKGYTEPYLQIEK